MMDEGCYPGAMLPRFRWDLLVLLTDGRAGLNLLEMSDLSTLA
jgi:hypothetical protein